MYNNRHHGYGTAIKVDGQSFISIDAAARYYGLKNITVHKRLKAGWPVDEAFDLKPHIRSNTSKPKICAIDKAKVRKRAVGGKVYLISNNRNDRLYVGATCNSLEKRLRDHIRNSYRGTSKLSSAMRRLGPSNFFIELLGEANTVGELADLETAYITSFDTIHTGYNISTARYNREGIKNVKYKGKLYTKSELASKLGLTFDAVRYRLHAGLPLERKQIGKAMPVVFSGQQFKSISDLARKLQMPRNTVDYHFHRGTLETAAGV